MKRILIVKEIDGKRQQHGTALFTVIDEVELIIAGMSLDGLNVKYFISLNGNLDGDLDGVFPIDSISEVVLPISGIPNASHSPYVYHVTASRSVTGAR